MRLGTALAGLGLLLALAFPAAAEERITRFVSDATVERDGTLDVTEPISFHVERDKIRRGTVPAAPPEKQTPPVHARPLASPENPAPAKPEAVAPVGAQKAVAAPETIVKEEVKPEIKTK